MRAAFYTLGCKVNQYETSVLSQRFSAFGFDIVEPEEDADVYVVNSCTVTAVGDKKSRQALRRFRRQNPAAILCLTGCFPQAFPHVAEQIPEADIIMGAKNRSGLLDAVSTCLANGGRIVDIQPHRAGDSFENMQVTAMEDRTRAFVKIQDGCERYCAYCIIPKARGKVRSKALGDIQNELEGIITSGYQEVVLAGINLSSYGQDLGLRLLDAVKLACSSGIPRVRLGSLEPELLTVEDITAMAGLKELCPQFHLSLQSGCDQTLKRMRRHYDTGEFRTITKNLRAAFPDCAITTDIMTGFPGETEDDHKASLSFAEKIRFAKAHIFAFSQRPGTLAATLSDQIPAVVKARRSKEMSAITDISRQAFLQSQTGKIASVLFETGTNGQWMGYSKNYTPVTVLSNENLSGKIHNVHLTGLTAESVQGDIHIPR